MALVTKRPKEEMARLWTEYKGGGDVAIRNILAEEYLPIVKYVADRMIERLPHNVQVEDLCGAGLFGLLDAIDKFDMSRGVKFETYCVGRIRGSILDDLRNMDWVPRLTRARSNKLEAAYVKLERELGRAPTDVEVSREMKISIEELDTLHREVSGASMIPIVHRPLEKEQEPLGVDVMEDPRVEGPLSDSSKRDFLEFCHKKLSTKERNILSLYYYDDLTLKEIGRILGLSESRVCQLHAKLVTRLRAYLARSQAEPA
ncbi:MAG TPA: FliA/WhiG family RNA polymerase sigma factor [Planctomycetota bacterium]|nr:FliA/WhiG family RNA polymerase sigma factor [Planctomycetota bacterium]